jgi:hypothetical protein
MVKLRGINVWPEAVGDIACAVDGAAPDYFVRAVREGFFGKPVNGTYPPTSWVDIVVGEKETKQAPLSLVPGAIIGGRVYDALGALLPNANVQVYSVAYQTGFALLQPAIAGTAKTTDDRGEFRLFWIPPGDYFLGAQPPARSGGPGTAFQPGTRTFYPNGTRLNDALPIVIRGGEDLRLDIGIRSAPLFKIAGTVSNPIPLAPNPNGTGLQPATVFFHLANRDLETPSDATTATIPATSHWLEAGPLNCQYRSGSYEFSPASRVKRGDRPWRISGGAPLWIDARDVREVSIAINPR